MLGFLKSILAIAFEGFSMVFRGVEGNSDDEGTEFLEEPEAAATLVKLIVYYRHGHRPPVVDMNALNITSSPWPGHRSDILTKHGKMQCYLLGKRLRQRYNNILTPFFSKTNLVALSTSVDRTMMSSSLVLASIYPPSGHHIWNKDLLWSPTPIFLDDSPNKCFKGRRYLYEFLKYVPEELNEKLHALVPEVEKNCSYRINNPEFPHLEMVAFFDVLTVMHYHDMELPVWATQFLKQNEPVYAECMKSIITHTEVQKQLSSSVLGDNILSFLKCSRRVMLHCVHDINMYMLFAAFGFDIQTYPHPTSSIAIEFHEKGGEETVKVFYTASPQDPRIPITMKCGVEPSLTAFKEMLTSLRPEDYDTLNQTVPEELEMMKNYASMRLFEMAATALHSSHNV